MLDAPGKAIDLTPVSRASMWASTFDLNAQYVGLPPCVLFTEQEVQHHGTWQDVRLGQKGLVE